MKFLEIFRGWKDVQEHPAQTVIFSEQDPAEVMYFILTGQVELTLHDKPLSIEQDGGIIGEMAIIDSAASNAKATAITAVTLARLDRDQFKDVISKYPEFSLHVMAVLANRLRSVDKYITTQFEQAE